MTPGTARAGPGRGAPTPDGPRGSIRGPAPMRRELCSIVHADHALQAIETDRPCALDAPPLADDRRHSGERVAPGAQEDPEALRLRSPYERVGLGVEEAVAVTQQGGGRGVAHRYPDPVAPRVVEGEVAEALADRDTPHVVADRSGHIPAAVAKQLGAEGPIEVLVHGEQLLVEEAHLTYRRAAVHRGRDACAENLPLLVVLAGVLRALAAPRSLPAPVVDVSRTIQDRAVGEVEQLRGGRPGLWMGLHACHQLPQEVGVEFDVVVQQDDQLTRAGRQADVERGGHANVLRERDHRYAWPV